MAGDWIKVRDNIHEDPAVGQIATALGIDPFAVVGRLIRVWSWADQQSRDGHAHVSHLFIDQLVNTPGMGDAMLLVGWLEVPENGQILFPKFDRHMSKSAKKRALATRRKQEQRSRESVTPPSRYRHAKGGTREEKSSTNKHLPVTTSTPTVRPPPRTTKPPAQPAAPATPPNGRSMAAHIAQAAGVKLRKPDPPPFADELDTDEPHPPGAHPAPRPTPASNAPPPTDWESTPEGIDRAAQVLGMKRLPFEEDHDLAKRIEARIALG